MDAACAVVLGEMMSLCNAKGIGSVLTIVPDRTKDIGFDLLGSFRYGKEVDVTACETLADAMHSIAN
jgi:hypothetical protein